MTAPRLFTFYRPETYGWSIRLEGSGTAAGAIVSDTMDSKTECDALRAKWQRFLDAGLEPLDWIKPRISTTGSA